MAYTDNAYCKCSNSILLADSALALQGTSERLDAAYELLKRASNKAGIDEIKRIKALVEEWNIEEK